MALSLLLPATALAAATVREITGWMRARRAVAA